MVTKLCHFDTLLAFSHNSNQIWPGFLFCCCTGIAIFIYLFFLFFFLRKLNFGSLGIHTSVETDLNHFPLTVHCFVLFKLLQFENRIADTERNQIFFLNVSLPYSTIQMSTNMPVVCHHQPFLSKTHTLLQL